MEEILLFSDDDFVKYIKRDKNVITNRDIASKFLNLNLVKIKILSNILSDEILLQILDYQDLIDYEKFKSIFLPSSKNVQEKALKNKKYFKFIVFLDNEQKNSIFDLVSNNLKVNILNLKEELDQIDLKLYINLLKRIKEKDFYEIISLLENQKAFKTVNELDDYLNDNYKLSSDIKDKLLSKYQNGKLDFNLILKAKTNIQIEIFSKFGIVANIEEAGKFLRFKNDVLIEKEFIKNINEKHLSKLIEALKIKGEKNNEQIFLAAVYCYSLFGYANALSIIEDKFTFSNDATLYKSASIEYIDNRRQYRLENQDYFFSYLMLQKAVKALKNINFKFFKDLTGDVNEMDFYDKFKELSSNLNSEGFNEKVSLFLKQIIEAREEKYKQTYIKNYVLSFKEKNRTRNEVKASEICNLFENIDFKKVVFDDSGMPKVDERLQSFLLGNLKKNNDCLLRLIFNELAMGLNTTIDVAINNFDRIESIINNSKGKLSINSILDVIDVCKTFLYELQPDEQDITLADIAKILRSRIYCNETGEDLVIKAKELHKERRKKVSSTIPSVAGDYEGISYKTMNFDDPSLITIGIDTENCFKVGGLGESFLKYTLLNKNSAIVGLYDSNNTFYMCPFVRNGNGIYGNGIDPEPRSNELKQQILKALQDFSKKVIKASEEQEKIEFVAIMDLHQEEILKSKDYQIIKIDSQISIDESFYADYYKAENKCYVISSINNSLVDQKFYMPRIEYKQKRIPNYEYKLEGESDKERIQLFVNSIYYTSIDCKKVDQREKDSMKRNYIAICVDEFEYIIGNKDWFIAIDRCMNILSCCLPYDKRAMNEYLTAFAEVKKMYTVNFMEEIKQNEK